MSQPRSPSPSTARPALVHDGGRDAGAIGFTHRPKAALRVAFSFRLMQVTSDTGGTVPEVVGPDCTKLPGRACFTPYASTDSNGTH